MVAALILVAVATATPTPTLTPPPRPTVASNSQAIGSGNSETYGSKVPLQLRQQSGLAIEPEPTPTLPPNSLAAVAARIKINRKALAEMPKGAPQSTEKSTPESARPADLPVADEEEGIKAWCAGEWPSDYSMQAYCVKKQLAAVSSLRSRTVPGMPIEVFNQIRSGCKQQWGDDYSMRDYCENKQIGAWQSLQTH
ncbi:MAG TPA: hypothetical protein PK435_13325, partial [Thermoanaerobaculaceae bacterium]|nr:hypothetical protein [Thermoanaerobaculaceae bacterium]